MARMNDYFSSSAGDFGSSVPQQSKPVAQVGLTPQTNPFLDPNGLPQGYTPLPPAGVAAMSTVVASPGVTPSGAGSTGYYNPPTPSIAGAPGGV